MALKPDNLLDVLDYVADGVYFVDLERRITHWNKAAQRITGYSAAEVIGARCRDGLLMHVDERGTCLCHGACPLAAVVHDGQCREATVYVRHKLGHRVPVALRAAPLRNEQGEVIGAVETFTDHSRRQADLERFTDAERALFLDPITGLPNRGYFDMALEARLLEWRHFQRPFGLLLADIAQFKRINESHGQSAGDRVLVMVARTLAAASRSSDVVCRFGGDEFALLLGCPDAAHLQQAAGRILTLVRASVLHDRGVSLGVTLSVGDAMAGDDDPASLVARAQEQLDRAERAGGFCRLRDTTAASSGPAPGAAA